VSFTYEYARPALTVDCVVFGYEEGELRLLLIQRDQSPHAGSWALPGGFVEMDEDLETAARRELEEETGVRRVFLEQLYSFGDPGRDPRERIVTVAWWALVKLSDQRVQAATDARDAGWFAIDDMPRLAFDHKKIVRAGIERLRGKVRYQPVGFELLPKKFTLTQLQRLYEAILDQEIDKRNFRRKVLSTGVLEELDEVEKGVARRAARLFRFDRVRYRELVRDGFDFAL